MDFPLFLIFLYSTIVISRLQFQVHGAVVVGDEETGFTVNLIHRDSHLINSLTKYDLINRAFQSSHSRHRYFSFNHSSASAPAYPGAYGDYIMNISIGNPPVPFLGLIDTGSNLIWMQCKPCIRCYHQTIPIYNPSDSTSYKPVTCSSSSATAASTCKSISHDFHKCTGKQSTCSYNISYADGSVTQGELATEMLTFGGKNGDLDIKVPGIVFGCGHYNRVSLNKLESGLIGLGSGSLSLIGQTPAFGRRFSHCLIPPFMEGKSHHYSGRISFGREAIISGSDVVSTPYTTKPLEKYSLYYITLESISVGTDTVIPYINSKETVATAATDRKSQQGNIFIDSGTPLTYLKESVYRKLESKLKDIIPAKPISDPKMKDWGLCYQVKEEGDYGRLGIPNLIFHFAGGADVELKPSSTFIEEIQGVVCITILPSHEMLDRAIFGSLLQMGYLVGFDLDAQTVSFKPTPDCSAR